MNRGLLGLVKGQGSGMGLQRQYLGYNNIGWQTEQQGVNAFKSVFKKITPPKSGLLVSVEGYISGNSANVNEFKTCVHVDNAGVPGTILSVIGAETQGSVTCLDAQMDVTPRWFGCPCSVWLQGGQSYWLCAKFGFGTVLYYNSQAAQEVGTAVDLEWQGAQETWHRDGSTMTFTLSSKNWCVRAPFVY